MRFDILDKFGTEAIYKPKESLDEETLTPIEGIEKTILCHKYGETKFIRDTESFELVSAQCYLLPEDTVKENNIKLGDYLDGQPIKIMNEYPIPQGRIRKYKRVIYEIYTYKR